MKDLANSCINNVDMIEAKGSKMLCTQERGRGMQLASSIEQ